MTLHPIQNHAGAVGAGVSAGAGMLSKVVAMTPELQALSIVISIVAGVLTVIWYVRRLFTGK